MRPCVNSHIIDPMSCVLRAHGASFEVKEFLESSSLQPDSVYVKGDVSASTDGGNGAGHAASGFTVRVGESDLSDLEGQVREAIAFLDEYEDELRRLGGFEGVEAVSLDFGVRWRETASQTDVFPSDLLWRAGALDIWLAVTHYLIAADDPSSESSPRN